MLEALLLLSSSPHPIPTPTLPSLSLSFSQTLCGMLSLACCLSTPGRYGLSFSFCIVWSQKMREVYNSAGLYSTYQAVFRAIPPHLAVVPYLGAHTKEHTVNNVSAARVSCAPQRYAP
jgi:hypothetical protein